VSQYSPGPYRVVPFQTNPRCFTVMDAHDRAIAEVFDYGDPERPSEANARLIAAAPELAEILDALTEWIVQMFPGDGQPPKALPVGALMAMLEKSDEARALLARIETP
jgi:hypothetical protein